MKWFFNISTRTKLFVGFGLMIIFLAIVIITGYNSIKTIQKSQEELYRTDFSVAINLVEMRSGQNRARAQLLEMMMTDDRKKQQALEQDIKERSNEIDQDIKKLFVTLKSDPSAFKKLEELNAVRDAYRKTREEEIFLIYKGKKDEARQLGVHVQEERYNKIRDLAKELGDHRIEHADLSIAQSEKLARKSLLIFVVVGLLALLMGAGMTLFLSRIIAGPLNEISRIAERLASGDLAVNMSSNERKDEVGSLKRAFTGMTLYLREIAGVAGQIASKDLTAEIKPRSQKDVLGNALSAMTGNLRLVTKEIQESVNVLVSSASEILATTTQVASGATETATSVSQTTATVEEVKQTAQLSTEKSRSVSDNAQKAALVAKQGDTAVKETVEGVNRIRGLMESVAESTVKLSEQTQSIGEIITTVNDLAQQSNLLSVNAAIEASKAGEHGKGFAVVAQEIRSLADQSKQATEQVRTILSDIQKATSMAVMSAEQVSKAVDVSVKQSTESGESIKKLAESITEAAQASTQIAASSQQQLVGMDQIANAMENIKQAAQQNMAGTKQAEQAAHNLNELGQKLKEIVGRYKV